MKTLTSLICSAVALVAIGCEDGPSGPHPANELDVYFVDGSFKDTLELDARMVLSGSATSMTTVSMPYSNQSGNALYFHTSSPVPSDPALKIQFKTMPTATGTFAFTPATVQTGGALIFRPVSDQGVFILNDNTYYGPVSGSITITNVIKDGLVITGYEGYVNGTVRSVLPKNWSWMGGAIPPGFNPSSPTMVGETLTLHSASFRISGLTIVPSTF